MQSVDAKEIDKNNGSGLRKSYSRTSSSGDQEEQGTYSLDLWKKAFRDAFERLCPVRAGGHECGCLHMLARLVSSCAQIFPHLSFPEWEVGSSS